MSIAPPATMATAAPRERRLAEAGKSAHRAAGPRRPAGCLSVAAHGLAAVPGLERRQRRPIVIDAYGSGYLPIVQSAQYDVIIRGRIC